MFSWIKQAAVMRQLKTRERSRVGVVLRLDLLAYYLSRLAKLLSPREALAY